MNSVSQNLREVAEAMKAMGLSGLEIAEALRSVGEQIHDVTPDTFGILKEQIASALIGHTVEEGVTIESVLMSEPDIGEGGLVAFAVTIGVGGFLPSRVSSMESSINGVLSMAVPFDTKVEIEGMSHKGGQTSAKAIFLLYPNPETPSELLPPDAEQEPLPKKRGRRNLDL